jgi:type IV secretory pathway VirB2 component (pilin)
MKVIKYFSTRPENIAGCLLAIIGCLFIISNAHAGQAIGDALCKLAELALGKAGRGLATLAVIILGIGATLGKVSWGMAIIVTVGIAVVFNAETFAVWIGGPSGIANCVPVAP